MSPITVQVPGSACSVSVPKSEQSSAGRWVRSGGPDSFCSASCAASLSSLLSAVSFGVSV